MRGNSNKRTVNSEEAKAGIESAGFIAPAVVLGKKVNQQSRVRRRQLRI
jgi:hypothetical protein